MTTTLDVVAEVEQLRTERDHYKAQYQTLRDECLRVEAAYRQQKIALKRACVERDHYFSAHTAMHEAMANTYAIIADAAKRALQAPYAPMPCPPKNDTAGDNGDGPQDLDEAAQAVDAETESIKRMARKLAPDNNYAEGEGK